MAITAKQKLGERELDIMQALWHNGPSLVAEVHQALSENGDEIAYTTVQTMLNRLEAKGFVIRDDSDRAYRYRAVLKEPAFVNGAIKKLTQRFFNGSVEALATRLVEKDLSPQQLDRIQELIDAHRAKGVKR